MLGATVIGLLLFLLIMLAIAATPLQSAPFLALGWAGHAVTDLGAAAGEMLQLPVTVPIYLFGGHEPLLAVQRAALQDHLSWVATLMIWATLALLVRIPRPGAISR